MYKAFRLLPACLLAVALAACSSNSGTSSTVPTPLNNGTSNTNTNNGAFTYSTFQNIAASVIGSPMSATTSSWGDIVWADPQTDEVYFTDSIVKAIDVFTMGGTNTTSNLVALVGKGTFTGRSRTIPSSFGLGASLNGPDGVVAVGGGVIFAGDGNSNVQVLNVTTGATLSAMPTNCASAFSTMPATGITAAAVAATPPCGIYTGGTNRADELAFDPNDNGGEILIANCCESGVPAGSAPNPFGTFVSTTSPYNILGKVQFPLAISTTGCAADGVAPGQPDLEQSVYDPNQKLFFINLPCTTANPNGEVDAVSPTTFSIVKTYGETNSSGLPCNATGMALNPSSDVLFLGCGNPGGPLLVMNPSNGTIVATVTGNNSACPTGSTATNVLGSTITNTGIGGADETWYNPTDNRFYAFESSNVNCNYNSGNGSVMVVDASRYVLLGAMPSFGGHSGAVDPATNKVFVGDRPSVNGGNPISVFSH